MRRLLRLIAILAALTAVVVAIPGPTAADEPGEGDVPGAIDLVRRSDGATRVVGWVASGGPDAPSVRVVADGDAEPLLTASQDRLDVAPLLPAGIQAWGWEIELDREVSWLCASVVRDGTLDGLGCWTRDRSAFLRALGGGPRYGSTGTLIRYSVEVEAATGLHPEDVAREVDGALGDPRSWAASGEARFERVAPANADLRLIVATPSTTDRLCVPFRTGGVLSCNNRRGVVALNLNRWRSAVGHWTGSLAEYRGYLINHEVGHELGYQHVSCPRAGALAPVMMQQSKSLGGCRPNAWPFPDGPMCLGEPATIIGAAGQPVVGTSGPDVIVGTAGPDDIRGGGGADLICGMGGDDVLRGNGGRDRLRGDDGADVLIGGKGRDVLDGGRGRDDLAGNSGRDVLIGGSGRDRLDGGAGQDTCDGGAGTDELVSCGAP